MVETGTSDAVMTDSTRQRGGRKLTFSFVELERIRGQGGNGTEREKGVTKLPTPGRF